MIEFPPRLRAMMTAGLECVADKGQREQLRPVAEVVATACWRHWQAWRPSEDNRPEHEWVVFQALMAIAEGEGLSTSDRRVAAAFCFTHDTHFIPRITEAMIRDAEAEAGEAGGTGTDRCRELLRRAEVMRADKADQRRRHMEGGARNARHVLTPLRHPRTGEPLLTGAEVERCVGIVASHDLWKLGEPYPPAEDRLAVACVEADALWPLSPLGVLADLERPDAAGDVRELTSPAVWRSQLENSLKTLRDYRSNWPDAGGQTFADDESIFRTREGGRLYREWVRFWGL